MQSVRLPLIIGVGEVLWDLLATGRQVGGAPANFAYHASCLGADAHVVSAVGDDPLGRQILARLDELGIARQQVAIDGQHPTGTVSVALDGQGKPRFTIHEGVAWDHIPTTLATLELARHADAICFGSLAQRSPCSQATVRACLAASSDHCLKVFDINLRQRYCSEEIIKAGLAAADVLRLNDEELPVLSDLLALKGDETSRLHALQERYGLRLIALTNGPKGATLINSERVSVHAGVSTNVADTVGAGDAFTAAVTVGLLNGLDLDAINEYANHLAGYVCSQPGATPKLPQELLTFRRCIPLSKRGTRFFKQRPAEQAGADFAF